MTYKPNWRILATRPDRDSGVTADTWVRLAFQTQDATGQETGLIHITKVVILADRDREGMDEEMAMEWLRFQILALEQHEMNEWLKLDGKLVAEPHPERTAA